MRVRTIGIALSFAGFVLFSWPGASMGQGTTAGKVSAAAEIGWRTFVKDLTAQQLGKFEEYKATPSGALLRELLIGYTPGDGFNTFQLSAREVGEADQSLALRANLPARFDLQLRWDRIPHTFSTNGRSLGSLSSPDVFILPAPRPDTGAWNRTSPYLSPIRTRWNAIKAGAVYTPSSQWDFKAEYVGLGKKGERPIGMAFGSPGANLREILEPIDQNMHDVKFTQSFASRRFQASAMYDLSLFRNAYTSVTSDNPLLTTDLPTGGSSRGRVALAPDNLAHTAVVNAALNLPLRTRASGSASYAWWRQDETFIPATINSAIVDSRIATLPTHLGGKTGTSTVSLSATSRPLAPLTVSARFRNFSYRDDTELDSVPVLIVNDRSISNGAERERFPFTRKNADVSASWRLQQAPVTLSAGYAWDHWARNQETRNVYRTSESAPRLSVDLAALDWLDLRGTYTTARRRAKDPYIQNTPADLPEHRRFDQADRDRQRLNLLALLTPLDALSLSATWSIGRDKYPASLYGLQRDRSTMIGGDVAWVSSRVSIDAGFTRETFLTRLRSRYRVTGQLDNLSYDWVANTRDAINTTSAGFTVVMLPDRLQAGGRLEISSARFTMATYNPVMPTGGTAAQNAAATASDLPVVTQKLRPISLFLSYRYSDNWAATVRYQTERYDQNDFRTLDLLPAEGNGIFLGNDFRNYDAHFVTFSLAYRPGVLRLGRSAL